MAAAWSWPQESGAARLRPCQACEAPGQAASLRLHHSFPRRRAGWRIFCSFLFCSTTGSVGKKNSKKIAVSFFSGSQEGEDGSARDTVSTLLSPSPFASGQQGPVWGCDAFSCTPCPAMEPGTCRTTHSDTILGRCCLPSQAPVLHFATLPRECPVTPLVSGEPG